MKRKIKIKLTGFLFGTIILLFMVFPDLCIGQSIDEATRLRIELNKLYKQGRYQEAIPVAKRVLAILEKSYDPEHPDVATSVNNLAALYKFLGNYGQAEPLFLRALGINERALGFEHPSVAGNYNNLASLYNSIGDYGLAKPMYERALAINEKTLGPEHPRVAKSLNNLAKLYESLGHYGVAEPLYKRALAIREKALGPEHPDVATSLSNLAILYEAIGDYSQVESLFKRAVTIRITTLGQKHPLVAGSRGNLAQIYLENGKIDKAFKISEEINSPMGRGGCYLAWGNYQKAKKEFQESLEYDQRRGQKKFIITSHIGLGLSYEGLKDFKMAKQHFIEAINLIEAQWQTLGLSARTNFLAGEVGAGFSRLDAYEGMVRVIIEQKKAGYEKEALEYSERVKSRTLL